MNFKNLKNKLWFNIFIRIAAIFLVFVLVLTLANVSFLVNFFISKEKTTLKEQILAVEKLDFNDTQTVAQKLYDINEKFNIDIEIYNTRGEVLYTTHGGQMMDFFNQKNDRFSMAHEPMKTVKTENLGSGVTFEIAERKFDKSEYLICRKQITDSIIAEASIQKQLIANSAAVANEFIVIISLLCLVLSIIWVLIFARKFSKPISEMNEITRDMARLDFSRKLEVKSSDEIGQLSQSVNGLSDSLSSALENLKATNEKLRDEIELERKLDVMRKGFVANVSHELKTPISIISGYAEGLKLNVNSNSKEEYCDTIIEESQRMNKLVLSILELSKYESGQIPLEYQSFDISLLASTMLERIFKGKEIETYNSIKEETYVYADILQIEQVFKALLENAASHTEKGGKVNIEAEERNGKLIVSVFNTGKNIDEEKMPEIWQSFYRGDKSRKRESNRFGLGLSIVAAIMKMHNNPCGVYNTENGVCFWFSLDLQN